MRSLSKEQAERLRKQRERQRAYRVRLKTERRPSRDDIARVVLHFMIVRASKDENHRFLEQLTDLILKGLKSQGFDEDASLDVLDDLIAKYTASTWGFRRKTHMLRREVLTDNGNQQRVSDASFLSISGTIAFGCKDEFYKRSLRIGFVVPPLLHETLFAVTT